MRFSYNKGQTLSSLTLFLGLLTLAASHPTEEQYATAVQTGNNVPHPHEPMNLEARDMISNFWNFLFPTTTAKTTAKTTSSTKTTTSSIKTTTLQNAARVTTTAKTSSTSSKSSSKTSSSSSSKSSSSTAAALIVSESAGANNAVPSSAVPAAPVSTIAVNVGGTTINTNTTGATNATMSVHANSSTIANTASSTILVIARDSGSAYQAYSGLNAYGIPFQLLLVPQSGATLPVLNSSATVGNFGGIIVLSEVSYDYTSTGGGFASALTNAQWSSLYAYQTAFGVRMVRLDVYPSADSGTTALGGCCDSGQEQFISISNSKNFTQAGLVTGATLSTQGLYHYPAKITNSGIAAEIAQFGTTAGFSTVSTAAVINTFAGGRQQMVFFISWATSWSETSAFLQHAYITWLTHGLYAGYRRVNFGTQVDDMFLRTAIYPVNGTIFRIRPADLTAITAWIPTINAKMPSGSKYFMEIGHNGNGNIDYSNDQDSTKSLCSGGPIQYSSPAATTLEFQKPLGSGTNLWPATVSTYPYSVSCANNDPLKTWWATPANRDVFAHISHTFSHEEENNSTFYDIMNEITWNQAWLTQVSLSSASMFSSHGLIPPAITGLHNGDALRAWVTGGIKNAVGDNTRPALLNANNEHWPLMTTVAANGYDGVQITPRWSSNIYYNCDSAACTVQEYEDLTGSSATMASILAIERSTSALHHLSLRHDSNMFHQANLRQTDVPNTFVNGVSQKLSLIQAWTETAVNEITRLVTWPLITLKQDDLATSFANRMARDQCKYGVSYVLDSKARTITGVTVTANGNTCSVPIPVTVPGTVVDTKGFATEQIGKDPLTIWVQLAGSAVSFTLSSPVPW